MAPEASQATAGGPAPAPPNEPHAGPPTSAEGTGWKPPAATRSLRTLAKGIGALVGVASSVSALVFAFAPDLKPQGDAPMQRAELSDLRVDADATFGQYLARLDEPGIGYKERQLRRRGALLSFRVRIEGFKGTTLLLKWELFDDETGKQLSESKAIQITPTNETNEATWQFWLPLPQDRGRYVGVVELLEEKESHRLKLASLETGELRGLAAI